MSAGPGARRLAAEWWLVALLASVLVWVLTETRAAQRLDHLIYDQLLRLTAHEPDPRILLVPIDTDSLQRVGGWPWPRDVHARLVERLAAGAPRAIAYDVLFLETSEDDPELATAIRQSPPLFLPLLLDAPGRNGARFDQIAPVPSLREAAADIGQVNLHADPDGLIRRMRLVERDGERSWPHLVMLLARQLEADPRDRWPEEVLIPFSGPPGTYSSVSAADVLAGRFPPELLAGRIVIVGASAQGLGDRHAVARANAEGVISGIELQANLLDGLLNDRLVTPAGHGLKIVAGLIPVWALLLGFRTFRPRSTTLLLVALIVGTIGATAGAFAASRIWLPPGPAVVALLVVSPVWAWRRLAGVSAYMVGELARLRAEPDHFSTPPPSLPTDPLMAETMLLSGAIDGMKATRRFIHESLDQLPDAIFVVGVDGRIVLANRCAERLCLDLGFEIGGLFFRDLVRLLEPASDRAGEQLWPPPEVDSRVEAVTPDGRIFDILYTAREPSSGEAQSWIVRMSDVSAMRLAQRQRDDMLRFLTHDMRSPQASILALTSSAEPGEIDTRLARRIDHYAQRTLELADHIVHLARAELLNYEPEQLNLSDLLGDALDELWPQITKRRIQLQVHGDDLELPVMGEGSLLTRALINLIDNAVKYSPSGSRLECHLSVEDFGADRWGVCVIRDEGQGFSSDQVGKLFQRFQRGSPESSGSGGAGLGLSFVETVIHRHGGTISCESQVGKGSAFILRLPMAARPRRDAEPSDAR
ncbi:CHASE2 domain-containing protein [Sphingosinicella terrae]|uniref:CHASE2 domain-containing protein n=1 Tax=Sphingosinicella terrae TaxID=2172047 RepID=UPI0013B423CD|nr:CHASE2 domain-containing protein [Sphingosinicella terrae]